MTIFNNSHSDTERLMFHFTDDRSLFILSGANRDSYQIINAFVKDRLFRQHPLIAEGKIQFNMTCYCHPENCWKVLCFAYSSDIFPESNSLPEQAIPRISEFYREQQALLEGEKERLENALEFTCKSCDEMQIVIAEAKKENNVMNNKLNKNTESLQLHHSHEDWQAIEAHYLEPNMELLLNMTDEQRENLFMDLSGNDGFLNKKIIKTYLSVINSIIEYPPEKRDELWGKDIGLRIHNLRLNRDKKQFACDLDKVNQKIKLIDSDSCSSEEIQKAVLQHKQILITEFEYNKQLELVLTKKIPILRECETIICSVLDGTRLPSPTVTDQILKLTKPCSYDEDCTRELKIFATYPELKESPFQPHLYWGIFHESFWSDTWAWTTDGIPHANQWTEEKFRAILERLEKSITAELLYWTERMVPHKEPI